MSARLTAITFEPSSSFPQMCRRQTLFCASLRSTLLAHHHRRPAMGPFDGVKSSSSMFFAISTIFRVLANEMTSILSRNKACKLMVVSMCSNGRQAMPKPSGPFEFYVYIHPCFLSFSAVLATALLCSSVRLLRKV